MAQSDCEINDTEIESPKKASDYNSVHKSLGDLKPRNYRTSANSIQNCNGDMFKFVEYTSDQYSIDDTPEFNTDRDIVVTNEGQYIDDKQLNIEKFVQNSKFDKFRTPMSKRGSLQTISQHSESKPELETIEPRGEKLLKTGDRMGRRKSAKPKDYKSDFHLQSNSRRKTNLSKSRKHIEDLHHRLQDHDEDMPEEIDDESVMTRYSSQVYLKYKEMFEKSEPTMTPAKPSLNKSMHAWYGINLTSRPYKFDISSSKKTRNVEIYTTNVSKSASKYDLP